MPPMAFTPRRQVGFTLIELMITIFVLAILLGVGVPSFQSSIRDNATATTAGELAAAIALAKSEAIKRSAPVTMCPRAASGTACGDDWAEGWIIFAEERNTPPKETPKVVAANIIAETSEFKRNKLELDSGNQWVRFSARGLLEETAAFVVQPSAASCKAGSLRKNIALGLAGRISVMSEKVPEC